MTLLSGGVVAIGVAVILDRLMGEPPDRYHPVAWYGKVLVAFDRNWNRPRVAGIGIALGPPLVAAGVAALVVTGGLVIGEGSVGGGGSVLGGTWVAGMLAGGVLFVTTSLRGLLLEAGRVVAASEVDPEAARRQLPALVGRDPATLSPGEIRSAAIESAAENLADGLVGPLLAFVLLAPVSLPLAAGGATFVKAVNTADSMFGYPDVSHGWGPARLDDVVMYLPARLTAVLVALVARSFQPLGRACNEGARTPSPNAGWPMAALADHLDVQLSKPGVYALLPDRPLPDTGAATQGIRTVGIAGLVAYGLAGIGVVAL